jgi:hypothetical protein
MVIYNEPLEPDVKFCTEVDHEHLHDCKFLYETFFINNCTNMEIVQNFEVICDRFNVRKSVLVQIMHRRVINCLINR